MLLVVGLGNPGPRYQNNRHNIGFMALERIAASLGSPPFRARFDGLLAEGKLGEEKILLLKPMTFMNESGRAVGPALRFYKLAPENLVVFHDEIDLKAGKIKVKTGGGAAGHNGIKSIDAHIGPEYRRVRIGVGHPGGERSVVGHVLGDFAKEDARWRDPLLDALAAEFPLLVEGKDELYMTKVAARLKPQPPSPPKGGTPPPTGGATAAPTADPAAGGLGAALARALKRLKPS
ncbi:MAG: aminoacyl-tRNA hydrolase [Alphaproteobacteria bacterium]|nr:aminoacyl-tRNA hydrolase [Alphaproteobacteria bacterium]